jgi:hypothetical protein
MRAISLGTGMPTIIITTDKTRVMAELSRA